MSKTLNLIMKTTRKCNLRCSYCHDWRSKGRPMGFDVLANVTAKALAAKDQQVVNFIWHGGEPLVLGRDYFARALALQKEFIQPGQYVINSLQTNGTLLTDDWCDFLSRNKITLGISIDGPRDLHDMNRRYANGKSSYEDVKRAISMAERHNLSFGVLMVLNENTQKLTPAEIFDFMLNDIGVTAFSFLPAVPDNMAEEVSGEIMASDYFDMRQYEAFMQGIFDHWYALGDSTIQIREIDGIMRGLMKGNPGVCTLAGGCLGENFHIDAGGEVSHCDKYLGDPAFQLGNILDTDFDAIRGSAVMQGLIAEEAARQEKLKRCSNFGVCHGGCPHDRYIARKYDETHSGACCGQGGLIDHIRSAIAVNVPPEMELI
ncbi:MAG: radical SAM protein [Maritimibacter sp.]